MNHSRRRRLAKLDRPTEPASKYVLKLRTDERARGRQRAVELKRELERQIAAKAAA